MERKKAIILDMDETLEHGRPQRRYYVKRRPTMILRPNLEELIEKLQEAKREGIDIILCTTATEKWVERFFKLNPQIKEIFDKILTRNNEEEWLNFSKEEYPVEYNARSQNVNLEYAKPVTTFGYDSVLYIDNNELEGIRLQILFSIAQGKIKKDVTFFSAFGFNAGGISCDEMLEYKKLAKQNEEFSKKLKEYTKAQKSEPGCRMMCLVIDKFINKDFVPGLTLVDEEYSDDYNKFHKKISLLKKELEELSKKYVEK